MKVFVFTAEQVYNSEVLDLCIEVFHTKKEAEKCLKWFVEDINNGSDIKEWVVTHNMSDRYLAYRDGNYPENHVELLVTEKMVSPVFDV